MKLEELLALVDYLVDDKLKKSIPEYSEDSRDLDNTVTDNPEEIFNKFTPEQKESLQGQIGPRGRKGERGFDGKDGVDGKDFNWENHRQEIFDKIDNGKLKFSDLSEDEKASLRGPRGMKGQKGSKGDSGKDGKIEIAKLTDEEKSILQGPRGLRGQIGKRGERGDDGISFSWESHKEKITEILDNNKLKFKDLTEIEKSEIKGEKGPKGSRGFPGEDGKSFVWATHEKEIFDRIDSNKLTFSSFTSEEKLELRGSRGQRGKSGANGLSAYETWLKTNDGSEIDFLASLRGLNGSPGTSGLNGLKGDKGDSGEDGVDGSDAPYIYDVLLKEDGDRFYFSFLFSDESVINTRKIDSPAVKQIIQRTESYFGNSGGGGGSTITVYKDNILAGVTEEFDFVGDNISVVFDELTKRSTVSVESPCIVVQDEGIEVTSCLTGMNFIGDNVSVTTTTVMADWALLSDVDFIGTYEVAEPGFVNVNFDGGSASAAKLALTKIADEDIAAFDLVRLTSNTNTAKCDTDTFANARARGIALTSATTGNPVEIVMFGIVEDASFTFPVNEPLFLTAGGSIGTTPPSATGKFLVTIGQSLGTGAIFISISEPGEIL